MRILADENIPLINEFFDSLGDVVTMPARAIAREHTERADVLLVRSVRRVDRELVADTSVKFVGTCTAGIDHLDIQALDELGICWRSAAGSNADSVGDYVFSCLAALDLDLLRQTVGIIGCGNVGSRLHKRLRELGVTSRCYDPLLSQDQPHLTSLDAVLQSDIICVHAPLTTAGPYPSFHLLGEDQLRSLKPGATVISAGRGGVVDNAALKTVLIDRRDLRVVLDVWESEPDLDLELFKRVSLGTPHIAGHAYDGKVRGTEMIYRALCKFLGREASLTSAALDRQSTGELISLQAGDKSKALKEAILSAYDIREDHARLKCALESEPTTRQAFDLQRKHYPRRREFSARQVQLAKPDPELDRMLRALGFQVVTRVATHRRAS